MTNQLIETTGFLESKGIIAPEVGIILGTGLSKLVHSMRISHEIDYKDIPNFVQSTVEFHAGKLIYGTLAGKRVLAMQGRFHFYEGYSMQQITFPIQAMKALGVKHLLLSNAAGAINLNFKKGELMLIDDHIDLLPDSPLIGFKDDSQGPRFTDMSAPYDSKLNNIFKQVAEKEHITLHEGVYTAVKGPNLETRAEYRYLKLIGADAVGMSTVPEVIVANQIGLACAAISVLTDECDPNNLQAVSIPEIIELAGKAEKKLIVLFEKLIEHL